MLICLFFQDAEISSEALKLLLDLLRAGYGWAIPVLVSLYLFAFGANLYEKLGLSKLMVGRRERARSDLNFVCEQLKHAREQELPPSLFHHLYSERARLMLKASRDIDVDATTAVLLPNISEDYAGGTRWFMLKQAQSYLRTDPSTGELVVRIRRVDKILNGLLLFPAAVAFICFITFFSIGMSNANLIVQVVTVALSLAFVQPVVLFLNPVVQFLYARRIDQHLREKASGADQITTRLTPHPDAPALPADGETAERSA